MYIKIDNVNNYRNENIKWKEGLLYMNKRRKIGIIILGITLFLILSNTVIFADDIKIIREKEGFNLEINSKLFDVNSLKPGDTEEAKLTIINKSEDVFKLSLGLERVGEKQEVDLFEQLDLTLNYDGDNIYSGKLSKLENEEISLGSIEANGEKEINAKLYLPGLETGNEYQNKEIEFNWIFKEGSFDTGLLPKTGENHPIFLYSTGILSLGLGIFLFFRKGRVNKGEK